LGVSRTTIIAVETGQVALAGLLREKLAATAPDLVEALDTFWKVKQAEIAERAA
jgi:DNA-binding XRE family transcriptional regulator